MKSFDIGKTVMVVVTLLFIATSTSANEEVTAVDKDLLDTYNGTHQEIISVLEHAKKNAPEIVKLMHEANEINNLMAKTSQKSDQYEKYRNKVEKLWESVNKKYGLSFVVASLHFENLNIEKAPQKKIEMAMNDTIAITTVRLKK